LLARDFGMSRGDAAVEVTRFMILGSGAHFFIALVNLNFLPKGNDTIVSTWSRTLNGSGSENIGAVSIKQLDVARSNTDHWLRRMT
jgi:hypothetical protein